MSAPAAAGAPGRGRRIPFVTVVVGLLLLTCGVLIAYVLYRGQQSVELLKRSYISQIAEQTITAGSRRAVWRPRGAGA